MKSYLDSVTEWAIEREIDTANPQIQMLKLTEEVGELASGIARGKGELIKDSIGDILVVLQVLSLQLDLSLDECLKHTLKEIKDRQGKMVNGIFVKEEDL